MAGCIMKFFSYIAVLNLKHRSSYEKNHLLTYNLIYGHDN